MPSGGAVTFSTPLPAVNDSEQCDRAWGRCRSDTGRGLQGLELAPVVAVHDVPAAVAQPLADGVCLGEVLLAPPGSAFGG